jgi:hypothetical protein
MRLLGTHVADITSHAGDQQIDLLFTSATETAMVAAV